VSALKLTEAQRELLQPLLTDEDSHSFHPAVWLTDAEGQMRIDEDENGKVEGQMRIDYDDQLDGVVDKVNGVLAAHGLKFEDDGKEYDGFIIYALVKVRP
jgi:hypothetical protein